MLFNEKSFYFFLQEIRRKPKLYLGGSKSLRSLIILWNGYNYGSAIKEWQKATGGDIRDYDEAIGVALEYALQSDSSGLEILYEFEKFVSSYYNQELSSIGGLYMILRNSGSDEEAFDKFFELFDSYLEQNADIKKQLR